MEDVYKNCPIYEDKDHTLRSVRLEDKVDLLKVYSDEKAILFFNDDNCGGSDFHYTTESRMEQAIEYQLWEYGRQELVRRTIVSKAVHETVGTIEFLHGGGGDYFTDCGLLRLDIRSDHEIQSEIIQIPALITEPTYTLFHCDKIVIEVTTLTAKRIKALYVLGFESTDEKLVGHDRTKYDLYFVVKKNQQDFKSECMNKRTCWQVGSFKRFPDFLMFNSNQGTIDGLLKPPLSSFLGSMAQQKVGILHLFYKCFFFLLSSGCAPASKSQKYSLTRFF